MTSPSHRVAVQPHGALLVLREPELTIAQVSANSERVLGFTPAQLAGAHVRLLGDAFAEVIAACVTASTLRLPTPVPCVVGSGAGVRAMHATVHREAGGGIVVELEPSIALRVESIAPEPLAAAIGRITSAETIDGIASEIVSFVRNLTGYDRVVLYRFAPDGHGAVIAESRDAALPPFVGLHYPASDVPPRARELYLRARVRLLTDVAEVPVPLLPDPGAGRREIDMSFCILRAASSRHLHFLRSLDVRSTLVASLVREGQLWGLIVCHDRGRKDVPAAMRAACELLAEVVSTRIAALESGAELEAELFGRALESRLISAAGETGDWRDALFDSPHDRLLRPLNATGAALVCDGEILTVGAVPSRAEIRAIAAWLSTERRQPVFHTDALARINDDFGTLTPTAAGLLAVELSRDDAEYLLWFRKEELHEIVWAREASEVERGTVDAWREVVHGAAATWTRQELAIAGAMRNSLLDVLLQLRALRAIIAERQATRAMSAIDGAQEPMIIADEDGVLLVVNEAFHRLFERPLPPLRRLDDLLLISADHRGIREALHRMHDERGAWRGELRLAAAEGEERPVAVRAEPIPGLRGSVLGYIMIFTDMRGRRDASIARARLEQTIANSTSQRGGPLAGAAAALSADLDSVLSAILANTSAAIVQMPDGSSPIASPPSDTLRELEAATRRATDLTTQLLARPAKIQDAS